MNFHRAKEEPFVDKVGQELKRAERYRIFISLIVFDLSILDILAVAEKDSVLAELPQLVKKDIRAIDDVSFIGSVKLALLLPETARQGAEIASRRISELIKKRLMTMEDKRLEHVIPLEMSSYPDAAGAKSISEFLKDLSEKNIN